MSLIDSMKRAAKATSNLLRGKKTETATDRTPVVVNYGTINDKAMGNFARMVGLGARTYPRMLHISKALVRNDVYELLSSLGLPTGNHLPLMVEHGRGRTRVIGANKLKRMADEMGSNNAERSRLRAKFKREHRAACPA